VSRSRHEALERWLGLARSRRHPPCTTPGRPGPGPPAWNRYYAHFARHTGQIILLAKRYAPGRVRFYEDAGGLATPLF
jgi:hypothetical protein